MNYTKKEVKKGITVHNIVTDKFKTNLYAVFLAIPLSKEDVTKNALITAVLRRGTMSIPSQDKISKELEEMYGASFDCGIEKTGDNHIIKFYLEALNEEFLPEKENFTQKCIEILLDIVTNPLVENGGFKEEYVNGEKENLKQIINGKIDNKTRYALDRCIEEMFKGKPYGLYKYGYIEDLEKITPQSLYAYYTELIQKCKIDIYYSGIFTNNDVEKVIIEKLKNYYPDATCSLDFETPFQILVAVVLSAQCTDERVNKTTPSIFAKYPNPEDFVNIPIEELEKLIHSCGFYKNKAKNLKLAAEKIMNDFNGILPNNMKDLTSIPGVGRKSANVIMLDAFNNPQGIAVDTHAKRLSNRIGFSNEEDPLKVEQDLLEIIPNKYYKDVNHIFVWHGRNTCIARKPQCEKCKVNNFCKYYKKQRKNS